MTPEPRRSGRGPLALAFAVVALGGCYRSHQRGEPADAGGRRDGGAPIDAGRDAGPGLPRSVDLLFVVDNSISMVEEQEVLAEELPRVVRVLATGDADEDGDLAGDGEPGDPDIEPVSELSIAVVTTDMGSGDQSIGGCPRRVFGDDGLFRVRGPDVPGCMSIYPTFLTFRAGDDAVRYTRDVSCVAAAGTEGCGLEQPLESALKALSPAAPTDWTAPGYAPPEFFLGTSGHGDDENDGFVRADSLLAIVVLSDDDDCSVADPALFDVRDDRFINHLNLRCVFHEDELLHSTARYVDGFLQLRRDPGRLVFVPAVGVPADLVQPIGAPIDWDVFRRDPRLAQVVDPSNLSEVTPSCDEPGTGLAYPPPRLLRTAQELEARGVGVGLASICRGDYAPRLLAPIVARLGPGG